MTVRKPRKKKKRSIAAIQDVPPVASGEQKYAIFSVGKEMFGFDLDLILETLYKYSVTPVAHLPGTFKGIIKLKGESIPVIVLQELLNEEPPKTTMQVCVIVLVGTAKMGFVVDSDIEIIPVTMGTVHGLPDCYTIKEIEFIKQIFWLKQNFIGILDPQRMMEILAGWSGGNEKK